TSEVLGGAVGNGPCRPSVEAQWIQKRHLNAHATSPSIGSTSLRTFAVPRPRFGFAIEMTFRTSSFENVSLVQGFISLQLLRLFTRCSPVCRWSFCTRRS